MRRLVVCGSPRALGRSAALAQAVCTALDRRHPEDQATLVKLADLHIGPCQGCDACAQAAGAPAAAPCVLDDDMGRFRALLDACDEFVLVSPVYFAGAPAQLKCLLDRLQPYFWTDWKHTPKRPADLYVVGEGTDPHGFVPLVATVRSSLAVAGFRLQKVHDWVGLVSAEGRLPDGADPLSGGGVHPASAYRCDMPEEDSALKGLVQNLPDSASDFGLDAPNLGASGL